MSMKSYLGLEKQPHILDPTTVLTATNLSFITPSYNTSRPISLTVVHFFIALHCISFLVNGEELFLITITVTTLNSKF